MFHGGLKNRYKVKVHGVSTCALYKIDVIVDFHFTLSNICIVSSLSCKFLFCFKFIKNSANVKKKFLKETILIMADEGSAKENEGDKKIVHTYPLVKVCRYKYIQKQFYFTQRDSLV